MTKQTIEQIKEKMRKLLEEVTQSDDEPQSIGNPNKIFEEEEDEDWKTSYHLAKAARQKSK